MMTSSWRRHLRVRPWFLAAVLVLAVPVLGWQMGLLRQWKPADPGPTDPAVGGDEEFRRLSRPKPGDWLYQFHEPGQTFAAFKAGKPLKPDKVRRRLVLQPIGSPSAQQKKLFQQMRKFCEVFFSMPTALAEPMALPDRSFRDRTAGRHQWRQYLTGHILNDLLKPRIPKDALFYVGITLADLYPQESWNFVFGQASGRVAVYSLARYVPKFPQAAPNLLDGKAYKLVLYRGCRVLAHETGHLFGLAHCVYYRCGMNGSNSLAESDRRPIWYCPVCLSKLRWTVGFDVAKRYQRLAEICKRYHWDTDSRWIDKRLSRLTQSRPGG